MTVSITTAGWSIINRLPGFIADFWTTTVIGVLRLWAARITPASCREPTGKYGTLVFTGKYTYKEYISQLCDNMSVIEVIIYTSM